ncbi:acyltransferase family protein [Novipirellula sp. SH528]|uniref:acyltransferase family protein n=1 Tax=Novipirellula sp. SH528 TaxID=3454466 RepID=UPI003F9F5E4F
MILDSETRDSSHLVGLDALRGLAIAFVLLSHLLIFRPLPSPFFSFGKGCGETGVSIFFVLSGFLITRLLLREQERFGNLDVMLFYSRRAARLLPAMWLYLIVVFVAWISEVLPHLPWHGFAASLLYVRNIFSSGHETSHLWSLSIEEQFYVIWPTCLVLLRRRQLIGSAIVLLIFVVPLWRLIAWQAGLADEGKLYMRTDFRADTLLWGSGLALLSTVRWRWVLPISPLIFTIFLSAVLVLVTYLDSMLNPPLPVGDLPIVLLGVVLIYAASFIRHDQNWIISPWVMLGRYSYGLYLWQQLFLGPPETFPILRSFPLQIALTFLMAIFSYHYLEAPILRWKDRFLQRTRKPYLKAVDVDAI